MHTDFIIVGQGICGTMLSWYLHREGKSFIVFDEFDENASSRVAAGIINPVTGRRYAYTWMIDEVMPFAVSAYREMGNFLNDSFIHEKSIIDFFPSAQMRNAFVERLQENDTYLHAYPDQNYFNEFLNYDFGCGSIRPAYLVHLRQLMKAWNNRLVEMNAFRKEQFDYVELATAEAGVRYKDITAKKIIFCDGVRSATGNWFQALPFAPNKGEALVIECRDLPVSYILKKGLILAPMPEEHHFWVGSNYQWEFEDDGPSEKFYDHAVQVLKGWLKKPFSIIAHKASVRPATIERRPFVGLHPVHPAIGILNGMGTKGSSLAPFFANQLVQHLVHNLPITPEADVKRFSRILSKTSS